MPGLVRYKLATRRGEAVNRMLLGREVARSTFVAPAMRHNLLELWVHIPFELVDVDESLKLFLDLRAEVDVLCFSFLQFKSEGALAFSIEGCHA